PQDPGLHGINFQELEARRQFEYKKFGVMLNYASRFRRHCYRSFILSYFGEWNRSRDCGNCSRCEPQKFPQGAKLEMAIPARSRAKPLRASAESPTIIALKIFTCVFRVQQSDGRDKAAMRR